MYFTNPELARIAEEAHALRAAYFRKAVMAAFRFLAQRLTPSWGRARPVRS
ncbi:MAG: hypothetical protein AAGC92_14370 [Pseudomonadota bacterium]